MTDEVQRKRAGMLDANPGGGGRNSPGPEVGVPNVTAVGESEPTAARLMEEVVERKNMILALQRVEKNKGAAGVDEMPVAALRSCLKEQWPGIKAALLEGRYKPQPVRRVKIPKPGGGMRTLGIPTVIDRLIQQGIHQVLSPIFDSGFSESSYGFRPNRSAHMAVKQAQRHMASGKWWVVDMDLEKFFDRVNHDILMARVARRVKDKRLLRLIRRYLQAGVMEEGLSTAQRMGTPQGGPLSPLLSNILLDDLDKELERRGHTFCRYADDCNIYVRTRKAGERVLKSITKFLEGKLKLRVNLQKSAVDRPSRRKFLGYSMTNHRQPRLQVAPESIQRLKGDLKAIFRHGRGRELKGFIQHELNPILRGWGNYFQLQEATGTFKELDGWVRRRLRCVMWRQWKCWGTRKKKLMARGLTKEQIDQSVRRGRGAWWNAGASHMNEAYPKKYFDTLGLVALFDEKRKRCLAV